MTDVPGRLRRAGVAMAVAAALSAALGLWMWFSSPGRPADIGSGHVPMAPTTGVLLLALSVAAIARLGAPGRRREQSMADVACVLIVVVAAAMLAARLVDTLLPFEHAMAPAADEAALPQGITSPVTACLFIISGVFLLLVRPGAPVPRWRHATAVALSSAVFVAALVIVTGYAYASPFLYGLGLIPVAFISGVAFLFMGVCCWTLLPSDRWPLASVLRPTITSRLLLVFVPLVLAIVLVGGALQFRVLPRVANPAEGALLAALATGIIAVVIVRAAAVRIGGSADDHALGQKARIEDAKELTDELDERVRERTRELTLTNAELEEFVYTIAHDLRSPLRSLAGFSEIVSEDYADVVDDTGRDYLRRIHSAASHMDNVLESLLALSRVNRAELTPTDVDLSAITRDIGAELQSEDARKVQFDVQDGVVVRADQALCEVLMRNLLGNAWKFSAKVSPARISFSATTSDGRCVFRVSDNGAGFDMQYADKLFRPFERLHSTDDYPGTGIGLATVRRIAERFGGECWARGEPGHGAVISCSLPAATRDPGSARAPERRQ